tara:strand:+ start:877 stop:2022 length:1146 start_codon:yes stop_codon:yes gene_type:complete
MSEDLYNFLGIPKFVPTNLSSVKKPPTIMKSVVVAKIKKTKKKKVLMARRVEKSVVKRRTKREMTEARGMGGEDFDSQTRRKAARRPKKYKVKPVRDILTADSKSDLESVPAVRLIEFIKSHNLRSIGSKQQLIDRAWFILHPEKTLRPPNMEVKRRGRPGWKKKYIISMRNPAFRPDESSEEDDDVADEIDAASYMESMGISPSVAMEDEEEMTTEEMNALFGDGVERDSRTSKGGWKRVFIVKDEEMEDEEEMTTEEMNALFGDGVERDSRTSKGGWKRVFIFKDEEMEDFDDDPDAYLWFYSAGEGSELEQVEGNYFMWIPNERDYDDMTAEYIFKETFDNDYLPYALGDDESSIEKFYKSPRDYDKEVRKIVNLIDY